MCSETPRRSQRFRQNSASWPESGRRPMIEVGRDHAKPHAGRGDGEGVEQRHGVRTAGERAQQRLARARRTEIAQGPPKRGTWSGVIRIDSRKLPPRGKMVAVQGLEPRTPRI